FLSLRVRSIDPSSLQLSANRATLHDSQEINRIGWLEIPEFGNG
ncbi:MAG: hypothetical protein RI917_812, partial [Actinomycetota bacterium]